MLSALAMSPLFNEDIWRMSTGRPLLLAAGDLEGMDRVDVGLCCVTSMAFSDSVPTELRHMSSVSRATSSTEAVPGAEVDLR